MLTLIKVVIVVIITLNIIGHLRILSGRRGEEKKAEIREIDQIRGTAEVIIAEGVTVEREEGEEEVIETEGVIGAAAMMGKLIESGRVVGTGIIAAENIKGLILLRPHHLLVVGHLQDHHHMIGEEKMIDIMAEEILEGEMTEEEVPKEVVLQPTMFTPTFKGVNLRKPHK